LTIITFSVVIEKQI